MSAHQKPRDKPFLDDPAAYPEFSLLIERERTNHAVRFCLHRHRCELRTNTLFFISLAMCD